MLGKNGTGVGNIGRDDISVLTVDCYNRRKANNQLENGKYYYTAHEGATSKTIADLQDEIDALDTTQDYKDYWSQPAPVTITLTNAGSGTYSVLESYKFPDHTYFVRIKVQYSNLSSNIITNLTVSNATAYWVDDWGDNSMYSFRINLYNDNGVAKIRAGNHSSETYWRTIGVIGTW